MRIAYLVCDFGIPVFGNKGASIHVRELTRALAALGHEVIVISPRLDGDRPRDYPIRVVELPLEPADQRRVDAVANDPEGGPTLAAEVRSMLYAATLRHRATGLLSEFRPDVIYERYALFESGAAAVASQLGIPYLLEVNAPLAEEQARHRELELASVAHDVEREILRSADHVLVVSPWLGDWVVELGVRPERVAVVPNGVDPARFAGRHTEGAELRTQLGFDRRPVVGFVSTLKAWHDGATLVRALAVARGHGCALQLLVVGDGPQRAELEALAASEGIGADARFVGSVPHDAVPTHLAAMQVGVVPYADDAERYFSPLKLFEYQAARLAVFAADVGELRHCVIPDVTGELYVPGDVYGLSAVLERLAADPDRATELGTAGRRHVIEHHTWASTAGRVVALVEADRARPAARGVSAGPMGSAATLAHRLGAMRVLNWVTEPVARRLSAIAAAAAAAARFRGELRRHWRPLTLALVCAIGYTTARVAEPWPLKFIFDNVLVGAPLETGLTWLDARIGDDRMLILAVAVAAILLLAVIRGLLYYYQAFYTSRVGQEVVLALRRRLFAHMQRLSLGFHARANTGDLLMRVTGDINMLRDMLVGTLLSLTSETLILVGFVAVMFLMEWRLALVALVAIPAIFALVSGYSARIRAAARTQRRREGQLASRVEEVLAGIHIVQAFAREDAEDERVKSLNRRSLRSSLEAAKLEAQLNRSVEITVAIATAVTLGVGALQVIAGRLTPGELIVFSAYMQGFYRPLRRISRVTERASKAASGMERVSEVLDRSVEVRDGSREAPPFRGEIRLEGVSFAYADGPPVLRGVDIAIPAGRRVALVGRTGAGKSTLLALVPRLYDPTAGRVTIDGHDLRDLTLSSLRDQISLVPQDGMLFSGTIRDNIAYGRPDASDAEIEAAARAAQIHDFVTSLANGYETKIGQRGVTLSGGQRQRLAIARALVKDAPIVLLDEPTTGLDAEAEALVISALDRLFIGRTALIVAHRLATIERVDEIIGLDQGVIVERGTHRTLLAGDGLYRALWNRQAERSRSTSASLTPAPPLPVATEATS